VSEHHPQEWVYPGKVPEIIVVTVVVEVTVETEVMVAVCVMVVG
jgi:hypothetical protein